MKKILFLVLLALAWAIAETRTPWEDGYVGAVVQDAKGGLDVYYTTNNKDWIHYLEYDDLTFTPVVTGIFSISEEELLIVGSGPSPDQRTGFVILNTRTNKTTPHPFFSASGVICAVIEADDGGFWIAGALGSNEQHPDLGYLARCMNDSQNRGCFPFLGPLKDHPPLTTCYSDSFLKCGSDIFLKYNLQNGQQQMWMMQSSISAWQPITMGPSAGWRWTCIDGDLYASTSLPDWDLSHSFLCQRSTNSSFNITSDPFAIVKVDLKAATCTPIRTSQYPMYLARGENSDNNILYYYQPSGTRANFVVWDVKSGNSTNITGSIDTDNEFELDYIQGTIILSYGWSNMQWWVDSKWISFVFTKTPVISRDILYIVTVPEDGTNFIEISAYDSQLKTKTYGANVYGPPPAWLSNEFAVVSGVNLTIVRQIYQWTMLQTQNGSPLLISDVGTSYSTDSIPRSENNALLLPQSNYSKIYYGENIFVFPPIPSLPMNFNLYQDRWYVSMPWYSQTFQICHIASRDSGNPNVNWTCQPTNCSTSSPLISDQVFAIPFVNNMQTNFNLCFLNLSDPMNPTEISMNFHGDTSFMLRGLNETILLGGQYYDQNNEFCQILMYNTSSKTMSAIVQTYSADQVTHMINLNGLLYFILNNAQSYYLDLSNLPNVPIPIDQIPAPMVSCFFGPIIPVYSPLQLENPPQNWKLILFITLPITSVFFLAGCVFGILKFRQWKQKMEVPLVEYVQVEKQLDGKFEEKSGRYLAKGAFGTVATVRHPNGGMYAVKKISTQRKQVLDLALREIEILKLLQHENTIRLRDSIVDPDQVVIYTDLFDGTISDLYAKKTFSLKDVMTVAMGVSQAVSYIQSLHIAHRDIKPSNILVSLSGHDRLESVHLADFGLATFVQEEDSKIMSESMGSLPFMAPELREISDRQYDPFAADVFSVGMTLWEVCHGQRFSADMNMDIPILLREEVKSMKKVISNCRKKVASERWSIDQVLAYLRNHQIEE